MDLSETTPLKFPIFVVIGNRFLSQAVVSPLRGTNHMQGGVKRFPASTSYKLRPSQLTVGY